MQLRTGSVVLNPGTTGAVPGTLTHIGTGADFHKLYELTLDGLSSSGNITLALEQYGVSKAPQTVAVVFPGSIDVPPTGVPGVAGAVFMMVVFLLLSAGLWGFAWRRRVL